MPSGEAAETQPDPLPVSQGRKTKPSGLLKWLVMGTFLAPLAAFVGAVGMRFGVLEPAIGYDLIGLTVVRGLTLLGAAAAVVALLLALKSRQGRIWALLAVAVAAASMGWALRQDRRLATAPANDVTSSPADAPPYSRLIETARRSARAMPVPAAPAGCPGLSSIPTQVAPETAAEALRAAGFNVMGSAPFRVEGYHEGYWFGFVHDAVIRIRPGQTDVRVTARDDRAQGPVACELASRIAEGLK